MTPITSSQSHEWWKDKTDRAGLTAFVESHRAGLREKHAVAWRRNVMIGALCVAVPLLLRMVTSL